ncbi:hypothetical protein ARMSODRAFT_1011157 [Armillaria solidipes]|uniref:Uncharacterized protein n=1 Tax=Armillaria solidipes TaxID=1076256 RepID=A0A2H3CPA7_9AGAR|nr:hypothetical protein ARMSODRAFT_1011157 [Armillaria solidipes]
MYQTLMLILVLLTPSRAYAEEVPPGVEEGIVVCIDDRRTLSNIVWSCLATVFACTWLAVHPNVPGRNITDSAIPFAIERMKIMVIAILAPEVIVAWAAEQFIVAWKVCHGKHMSILSVHRGNQEVAPPYWKRANLTMAHGFFLSMGGFYYTQQRKLVDLETVYFQPYLVGDMAAISSERIKDKSKGDALSKTVSILQISWFIAQCIARAVQDLPITLIEMTALAFSGLSIITYCLWWHKPLNVMYHIPLDGLDEREYMQTRHLNDRAPPAAKSRRISVRTVTDGLHWFLGGIAAVVSGESTDEGGHTNIDSGAFRFSSGTDNASQRFVITVSVGSLFGALHCIAWSFYFPSHAEMVLWRFSCLAALVGLPTASTIAVYALMKNWEHPKWQWNVLRLLLGSQSDSGAQETFWAYALSFISVVGAVTYIVARIFLIVLAFMQLRSLPESAFHTVTWTTYIPHI